MWGFVGGSLTRSTFCVSTGLLLFCVFFLFGRFIILFLAMPSPLQMPFQAVGNTAFLSTYLNFISDETECQKTEDKIPEGPGSSAL